MSPGGLGHIAVGMAAGRLFKRGLPLSASLRAQSWFAVLAMLPDADVPGYRFGVVPPADWGHRGATHSLPTALVVGTLLGLAVWRLFQTPPWKAVIFCVVVLATHGLLDTLTTGGPAVELFWPFSHLRVFAPWHPIPVAPIAGGMISRRGLYVTAVEALEFAPFLAYALWPSPRRA